MQTGQCNTVRYDTIKYSNITLHTPGITVDMFCNSECCWRTFIYRLLFI
jgi:hypothetical protein